MILPIITLAIALVTEPPADLTSEEKLTVAREQLAEQIAEAETARAQAAAVQAESRAIEARRRYEGIVQSLRQSHAAKGCDLTVNQEWKCPTAAQAAPSSKDAPDASKPVPSRK